MAQTKADSIDIAQRSVESEVQQLTNFFAATDSVVSGKTSEYDLDVDVQQKIDSAQTVKLPPSTMGQARSTALVLMTRRWDPQLALMSEVVGACLKFEQVRCRAAI